MSSEEITKFYLKVQKLHAREKIVNFRLRIEINQQIANIFNNANICQLPKIKRNKFSIENS